MNRFAATLAAAGLLLGATSAQAFVQETHKRIAIDAVN